MSIQNGKLIIAFDCFKTDQNLKNALESATKLSKKFGWSTQAVSVISPEEINWPVDFVNTWHEEFMQLGAKTLTGFLKRNPTKQKLSSKVLLQPYKSKSESVLSIINEAKKKKASAIAVFTHAYKKNKFSFLGGFVTSLIHKSRIPILVFNSTSPALRSLKTIMFATDFSREEAQSFKKCIELASQLKAKLILVHAVPNPYLSGTENWGTLTSYLVEEESTAEAQAQKWVEKANKAGVETSYKVVNNSQSIPISILKCASHIKADLIVITQRTGPWETLILGSVTRDVLAEAVQPVLVIPTLSLNSKH